MQFALNDPLSGGFVWDAVDSGCAIWNTRNPTDVGLEVRRFRFLIGKGKHVEINRPNYCFLTGLIGGGIAAIGWQTAHPATWLIVFSASAR